MNFILIFYFLSSNENNKFKDKKTVWKDNIKKDENSMANGGYISPLYTITSYQYWIRRNLIVMNNGDY